MSNRSGGPGPPLFSVFCFSKRPPARHPEVARPPTDPEIKKRRPEQDRRAQSFLSGVRAAGCHGEAPRPKTSCVSYQSDSKYTRPISHGCMGAGARDRTSAGSGCVHVRLYPARRPPLAPCEAVSHTMLPRDWQRDAHNEQMATL